MWSKAIVKDEECYIQVNINDRASLRSPAMGYIHQSQVSAGGLETFHIYNFAVAGCIEVFNDANLLVTQPIVETARPVIIRL